MPRSECERVFAAEDITGLDIGTAVVAGYAALVATVGLAFQIVQGLRTWQTRLKVELRRMSLMDTSGTSEPVVHFSLINHSGHPVQITHVGLTPLRKGGLHIFIPHPLPLATAGPFEIGPRDSRSVYITPDRIEDYDPNWKTRAQISTSDKRTFRSNKVRVGELVRD